MSEISCRRISADVDEAEDEKSLREVIGTSGSLGIKVFDNKILRLVAFEEHSMIFELWFRISATGIRR